MRFGLSAPFRGPLANPADIRLIAERAEALGYDTLTVSDHLLVPRQIDPNYPYSDTGEFLWATEGSTDCMEQFTLLAWLAAVTTDIRLLTSVVVVPHRSPVFMAKSIATTDRLSGGRVTMGVGVGWMREELAALGADFDARGRISDEYLAAMKALWTEDFATYRGEWVDFADVAADPKPVQKPHPPLWIGGESLAALKRTVALGDAWYPFGTNPKFRMDDVASFVARRDRLFGLAEAAGRDPSSIDLAYNCAFHDESPRTRPDGSRLALTGSAEDRAADVDAFATAGVTTMMINVTSPELQPMLERMEAFASDVMPLVS